MNVKPVVFPSIDEFSVESQSRVTKTKNSRPDVQQNNVQPDSKAYQIKFYRPHKVQIKTSAPLGQIIDIKA